MSNNIAHHGWVAGNKIKYMICSDGLKQLFVFKESYIFFVFFFQKLKQKYSLFIFITVDKF